MPAERAQDSFKIPWRAASVGMVVSALFTAFFIFGLHWEELGSLPERLDYQILALATGVLFIEFPLRALRWGLLIHPLEDKYPSDHLPFRGIFNIYLIGTLCNNIVPARAGDLVRPYLAAKDSRLPFESVFITYVLERGFDILGLVSVAVAFSWLLPFAEAKAMDPTLLEALNHAAILMGVGAMAAMTFLLALGVKGEALRPLVEGIARYLPGPVARMGLRLFNGLLTGLSAMESGKRLILSTILSIVIWWNGSFAMWLLTEAFDMGLPLAGAFFLQMTMALSIVLPQAPGFIGVFHIAAQTTLMAWGIETGLAQGYAVMLWLISMVPVTFAGFLALWMRPFSIMELLKNAAKRRPPAQKQEA